MRGFGGVLELVLLPASGGGEGFLGKWRVSRVAKLCRCIQNLDKSSTKGTFDLHKKKPGFVREFSFLYIIARKSSNLHGRERVFLIDRHTE